MNVLPSFPVDFPVKTERSRLTNSYGSLPRFCRPVIHPWAIRENNAQIKPMRVRVISVLSTNV